MSLSVSLLKISHLHKVFHKAEMNAEEKFTDFRCTRFLDSN